MLAVLAKSTSLNPTGHSPVATASVKFL